MGKYLVRYLREILNLFHLFKYRYMCLPYVLGFNVLVGMGFLVVDNCLCQRRMVSCPGVWS